MQVKCGAWSNPLSLPLPPFPLSFCVSHTERIAPLKQYLQPRAFISIWSTAHHQLILPLRSSVPYSWERAEDWSRLPPFL